MVEIDTITRRFQLLAGMLDEWIRRLETAAEALPSTGEASGTIPFFRRASPNETLILWHFLRSSGVTSSNPIF